MASIFATALLSLSALMLPFMAQARKTSTEKPMTAAKAFISAPASRFPLVPAMKRMDMVDYYNSGMDRPSDNMLGGKSRILNLTAEHISVEDVGDGLSVTSISLDKMGRDTVLIVTSNVATPAIDGKLYFYSTEWNELPSGNYFTAPQLAEWVRKGSGIDMTDIENSVPFVMADYSYSPDTHILTLKGTFSEYIPKEEYEKVKNCLLPEIRYKWNGKKMVKIK